MNYEKIFNEIAKNEMKNFSSRRFKESHPTLLKAIKKSMIEIERRKLYETHYPEILTEIYISGGIKNVDNYLVLFKKAQDDLIKKGYRHIINPATLKHNHDKSWLSYMREDIKYLLYCNEIYMLDNFKSSKGATIELIIAYLLGLKVRFQDSDYQLLTKKTMLKILIKAFIKWDKK